MSEVTQILSAIEQGDQDAVEKLLPVVYDELRAIARSQMQRERAGHTLAPTALVHEAYLKLMGGESIPSKGRNYFFAAAAEAMRRILIDRARAKAALKRGGDGSPAEAGEHADRRIRRISLDAAISSGEDIAAELLDLDEAMMRLGVEDAQKAALVKLRFFAGLTLDEAAGVLGIAPATADRHWRYARAWLYRELSRE